jgi:Tfp pilus assembly protein PilF/TolB-like protein
MILAARKVASRAIVALMAVGLAGCATGLPTVGPADIPRLQGEVASSPTDTDLQVQLGMAQFSASDFDAARSTLRGAIESGNESGAAYLYLGMVEEELQDWAAARDAYTTYLDVGASTSARSEVRSRLTLIGRNLLRAQAQQALAQEAEITSTESITPQSVAVLPMAFNSDDPELEPLVFALSDMMVTDFKVSNALTVLERAQIQTLLDEMALTTAGYAEAGTGARAGRLLRAEHVVQGVLTPLGGNDLQTDTDVLNVVRTASAGQVSESAALERVFDMEKQIVIRTIREVLGIELTPAEEQAILDNRMTNVLAFLAHGRGLRELDRGNYAAAQTEFELALQLEGGSYAATEVAMAETAALIAASSSGTTELSGLAGTTGETGVGLLGPPPANTTSDLSAMGIPPGGPDGAPGQGTRSAINTLRNISEGVDPNPTAATLDLGSARLGQDQTTQQSGDTVRDPVQEGSNDPGVVASPTAQIRIVIQRPGGAP